MLNVNGSLTKAGDPVQLDLERGLRATASRATALRQWLASGRIAHDTSHAQRPGRPHASGRRLRRTVARGTALGQALRRDQAILGVFDEGCMGMYNAIIPDELLHALGLFKERLSQSALYAAMREVPRRRRRGATTSGCRRRGMTFVLGRDEATELTECQVLEGLKMYDAAVRLAARLRLRRHRHPVPAGPEGRRASPRISPKAC